MSVLAALAVVALHGYGASAQGTNATCLPGFDWMTNSRGQSPCLMAAYLNSACLSDPQDAYVYSLPTDFHYRPPTEATATPCQCSTVFYSMIAACADCQDRENLPWSGWDVNCTTIYTGIWPVGIPSGTSIPAWAFLDVVVPDAFNITAAEANAAQRPPESTTIPKQTGGASVLPSVTASNLAGSDGNAPPAGPTQPASGGSSSSSHSSNTGAIVGGVVGGIAGAAIIAGIIAWLVIRSKHSRNTARANTFAPAFDQSNAGAGAYGEKQPERGYDAHLLAQSPPPPTTPLYNPDDPSTFPHTAPAGPFSGYASTEHPPSSAAYQPTPGRYTGVAEV